MTSHTHEIDSQEQQELSDVLTGLDSSIETYDEENLDDERHEFDDGIKSSRFKKLQKKLRKKSHGRFATLK